MYMLTLAVFQHVDEPRLQQVHQGKRKVLACDHHQGGEDKPPEEVIEYAQVFWERCSERHGADQAQRCTVLPPSMRVCRSLVCILLSYYLFHVCCSLVSCVFFYCVSRAAWLCHVLRYRYILNSHFSLRNVLPPIEWSCNIIFFGEFCCRIYYNWYFCVAKYAR